MSGRNRQVLLGVVGKGMAKCIDGERVRDYLATGRKDAYYEDVRKLLAHFWKESGCKYLFVIVPREDEFVYVWDVGDPKVQSVRDLGEREDDFEADEIRLYRDVIRQEIEFGCFILAARRTGISCLQPSRFWGRTAGLLPWCASTFRWMTSTAGSTVSYSALPC